MLLQETLVDIVHCKILYYCMSFMKVRVMKVYSYRRLKELKSRRGLRRFLIWTSCGSTIEII